jgi:translation initiation factor IF-2
LAQKKIRVHELSKELGLTSKELLTLAQKLGIGASSPSASIEDAQADRIRRRADADGLRREVQPEEAAKAAKAVKATKATGVKKAAVAAEPEVVEAAPARVSRVTKAVEPSATAPETPVPETPAPAVAEPKVVRSRAPIVKPAPTRIARRNVRSRERPARAVPRPRDRPLARPVDPYRRRPGDR